MKSAACLSVGDTDIHIFLEFLVSNYALRYFDCRGTSRLISFMSLLRTT